MIVCVCVCVGRVIGEEGCYLWREQQGHARKSRGLPCRESFFRVVSWWCPLWAPTGSTTWRKKKFLQQEVFWEVVLVGSGIILKSISTWCSCQTPKKLQIEQKSTNAVSAYLPSHLPLLSWILCYLSILLLVASVKCVCLRPLLPHLHLFSDILPNFVLKENDLALYVSCLKTLKFLYTAQFPNFPEDHWVSLWRLRRTDKWLCVC